MTTTFKPQRGLAAIKPYTPGKPIEEVQREYGLTDVIKLASNENPLGAVAQGGGRAPGGVARPELLPRRAGVCADARPSRPDMAWRPIWCASATVQTA